MKKQMKMWWMFYILACVTSCFLLSGCGKQDITKTITLDEKDDTSIGIDYAVKNIKEYYYEGTGEEESWISWDRDSENICILRNTKKGCEYQKVNMGDGKILSRIQTGTEAVKEAKISPGGEYIALVKEYAFGVELYLFIPETKQNIALAEAKNIIFAWSGDGKKLFFTCMEKASGAPDEPQSWCLKCCDTNKPLKMDISIQAEGDPGAEKYIMPNKDGSQVYVGYEDGELSDARGSWLFWKEKDSDYFQKKIQLPKDMAQPVCYTKSGLLVRDNGNKLLLLTNLRKEPESRVIIETDAEEIVVCPDGDHIFRFSREEGTEHFEIYCLSMKEGGVTADQILYKDVGRSKVDAVISPDDHAIVIKSLDNLGEKKYSYKVTLLEYGEF